MERQQEQQFSLAEVTAALDSLDVDARATVLDALHQQVAQREAAKAEQAFRTSVYNFAATYHRATAENASHSHIHSWYGGLMEESEELLRRFAGRHSLSSLDMTVRDAAAVTYAYLNLERDGLEPDSESVEVLRNAGVDREWLFLNFKNGFLATLVESSHSPAAAKAAIDKRFTTLHDFWETLDVPFWKHIVEPYGVAMRAQLQAAGFNLPELNADGKYTEDDELPKEVR